MGRKCFYDSTDASKTLLVWKSQSRPWTEPQTAKLSEFDRRTVFPDLKSSIPFDRERDSEGLRRNNLKVCLPTMVFLRKQRCVLFVSRADIFYPTTNPSIDKSSGGREGDLRRDLPKHASVQSASCGGTKRPRRVELASCGNFVLYLRLGILGRHPVSIFHSCVRKSGIEEPSPKRILDENVQRTRLRKSIRAIGHLSYSRLARGMQPWKKVGTKEWYRNALRPGFPL